MKRIFLILVSIVSLFSAFGKPNSLSPLKIDITNVAVGSDPGATPEQVKARLAGLDTDIEMRYSSEVQTYIDRYMKHGRRQLAKIVALSAYYLPIFESALREAGLPDELKYLPIIESGLEAGATSSRGAAGLWQFMPIAARGYDMKISSSIDERRDPYLSSQRACKMLRDLYDQFGDWGLVLAAYNAGPGTVKRALKRAGASNRDFWAIRHLLPAQTKKYLSLFTAMNYVMNFYGAHNIPEIKNGVSCTPDTIIITGSASLSKLAPQLNVSVQELKAMNPHFKTDMIPATASRPCTLVVPAQNAQAYRAKNGVAPEENLIVEEEEILLAKAELKVNREQKADDYAYEEVPSKIFPNTYVRRKITEGATRPDRRRKRSLSRGLIELED